jgi:hypothetical protein
METETQTLTDTKGQSLQTVRPVSVLKKKDDLLGFDRKVSQNFLSKKAEKLSTATYMITGFLSDNEPIKWQIRECGLKIFSDMNLIENMVLSEKEQRIKILSSEISKIVSLFEIAVAAKYISDMNCKILKEEYLSLVEALIEQGTANTQETYLFAKEFFSDQEKGSLVKKESPDSKIVSEKVLLENDLPEKEKELSQVVSVPQSQRNFPQEKIERYEKSTRRETVLRAIKDRGENAELSIKDIVGYFTDCGEKTVQRELITLVDQGILKKTGDRRWSRYSFK